MRSDLDDLPPQFRDLGAQLERAAATEQTRPRRLWRRPLVVGGVLGGLVLAGGVATATQLISTGEPVKQQKTNLLPPALRPATPGRIVLRATDSAGKLPWAASLFTNQAGKPCVTAGRLRGSQLGLELATSFRPLPAAPVSVCRAKQTRFTFTYVQPADVAVRTVIFGLVDPKRFTRVSLKVAGKPDRTLRLGAEGAFLAVFEGHFKPTIDTVTVTPLP